MTGEHHALETIRHTERGLTDRFASRLVINRELDRAIVSFQANKVEGGSRWFRYKEGFSSALMRYLFAQVGLASGHLLDPFAGSGTALFAASAAGMHATGIELLPCSIESIEVRRTLLMTDTVALANRLRAFCADAVWEMPGDSEPFGHITITAGAFPYETEAQMGRYLHEADRVSDRTLRRVLRFAALCVLEEISYTRKDGQYLRWDYRSGRQAGRKPFDKGRILPFSEAVTRKLREIVADLCAMGNGTRVASTLFDVPASDASPGAIHLLAGSCLELMPTLPSAAFDGIVTSPPYCNRYDYTRTYALELAMLGVNETEIRRLRQAMLSCTVENREKADLANSYRAERLCAAQAAFASQEMLQQLLAYLNACAANNTINNIHIPRMVRNYFAEMALLIFEWARILRPGAPLVMVNDNVRYLGAHVPVDLILSDFAMQAGFDVEAIWVLPRGKGNSSQQMGAHGREEIRKCVYVWRKLTTSSPHSGYAQRYSMTSLSSTPARRVSDKVA
jgi:hypothetical protein